MHPKIALCLITKDSAATIEPLLESVRPFVDGVYVYDTGSTDTTLELLERLNERHVYADQATGRVVIPEDARPHKLEEAGVVDVPLAPIVVEQGEWRDDFAWARTQSFKMPDESYDWLLWADDDDVIVGAHQLRNLAAGAPPQLDGYIVYYDYARDEAGTCVCQLWRERLIRRSAGYEWLNPVHEVLVPPGRAAVLANIPPETIRYIHNRPAERYAPDRNLKILHKQLADHQAKDEPATPRLLAYLGTEHMAKGEFSEGAFWLQQYVQHPEANWSDERAQVHHKLASCLLMMGNPMAAVEVEMQAMRERDDWGETAVGLGRAFATLGEWARAVRWARRALELGVPQTPLIINPLEFTLIPWLTIAECSGQLGLHEQALAAIEQAVAFAPASPPVRAQEAQLRTLIAQNEILGAVMMLRETLVRHDENLKAHHLLELAVPYVVEERPEIVKARADQREMVAHFLRPAEYDRWYRQEPKESTVGDELVPDVGDYIPRAKRLLEGLQRQEQELGRKPRLLDLGCNDMWMGCYLWLNGGLVVDGVELNKQSVAKGRKRMRTFEAPGSLLHGNLFDAPDLVDGRKYDAVSLFEVLEHVPDIGQCLDLMESLLKPGGVIYVSTPNGAYERGQIDGWARVERKGHLRAIPVHDLTDWFNQRGKVETVELQHDGRVTFASYRPAKRLSKIVFYAGAGWEAWSPASINTTGLGGSETALVQVAARLAQQGHEVKVYAGAEPGFYAGVLFRPHTAWDPTEAADLLVVSRLVHVFDNPVGAKKTALWCHDHSYPGQLTEERAAKIDHVVVLSDWQLQRFARLYPFAAEKLTLIRNGITLAGMEGDDRYPDCARPFADRKPRVVYSSSADRGLDVMLGLWPRIRERVTDAELHVFYGWDVFDRVAIHQPGLLAYKQRVMALADAAGGEDGGVFMRGRVGQRELAAEMMQARVWGYPTAFLETSCIGAMEARAAGLAIVTSDLGALAETVGEHGYLIPAVEDGEPPSNTTGEYHDRFVDAVCERLHNDDNAWDDWHVAARDDIDGLDWNERTREWEALVPARTAKKNRRARVAA